MYHTSYLCFELFFAEYNFNDKTFKPHVQKVLCSFVRYGLVVRGVCSSN